MGVDTLDTYKRVCVRQAGHEGDHLPYYRGEQDEHGNVKIQQPRCVHVDPVTVDEPEERYRIIFEMIDPRFPEAGWHEVGREGTIESVREQADGIRELEAKGDDVRNPRIERATVRWSMVEP